MSPGQRFHLAKAVAETSQTIIVVKTDSMRIVHLLVPAGQTIPKYEAQGEIVIHCLEGRVAVSAQGQVYDLSHGELLYLLVNEPFSVKAKEDVSLLVTMIGHSAAAEEMIGV
jgi:quercetin dioxygenase-like cupin family protein